METLELKKIVPDKDQPRKFFGEEKMRQLMNSIKDHGIMNPLIVDKQGDQYVLIDGERRYRAAVNLKLKEVPVIVIKAKDPITRLIEQFHIQEQHESWNPTEKAQVILDLTEKLNKPFEEICEMLAIPRSMVERYLAFGRLQNKEFFMKSQISIDNARIIGFIKSYAKRIKEKELGEAFTLTESRKLEKNLIEMIKSGEITSRTDYTKIKDIIRMNPKMIDKLVETSDLSISDMFVKSHAGDANNTRNLVNNAGFAGGHAVKYLTHANVKLSSKELSVLRNCVENIQKVLDLYED